MSTSIQFHIHIENPATHFIRVEMHVKDHPRETMELSMPVWTPGSYLIREYSKNVDSFTAKDTSNKIIPSKKLSKNKWQVYSDGKDFVISYNVYCFEESVRTNLVDDEHASLVPAALFILPDNFDIPVDIRFHAPVHWLQISSALEVIENNKWMRRAANKDELIDSPIEIGNHEIHQFSAAGVEHELAIYGKGNFQVAKMISDFKMIITEEVKIFDQHPCKKYLFILLNSNTQRGGLEHLHSTSLIFKRFNYEPENNYNEFISLVAHEYFHLWNVKRLRPAALGPFNYNEENYTTSLWIAEGFTSYYDDLIIRRCNLISERTYLDIVEKNLNDGLNPPGDKILPVAEASMEAWIKYYRQNENSPNTQTNYYVKGGLLAMMLDLMIIHNSKGQYSLDHVMREAYHTFYLKEDRGYTEEEFKSIIEKYTGVSLDDFYRDHVYGTVRPDFRYYFDAMGIEMKDANIGVMETDLGITVSEKNIITFVRRNSSGEKGGLSVNDELISIEDYRYITGLITTVTTNKKPGEEMKIIVSRNGIIKQLRVVLQLTDKLNYKLTSLEKKSEDQQTLYNKWISA